MKRKHIGAILVYLSLSIMASAQINSFMGFVVIGLFFMLIIGMYMVIDGM